MGPAFLLIGLILLGIAFYLYRKSQQWMASAQTTTGQIIRFIAKESTDNEGDTASSYYPLVQFQANGEHYEFQNRITVNPKKYTVGSNSTVWYNPVNPHDAKIDANMGNAVWPAVMGFLGLFLIWAGWFAWDV
jgi:hypothetical protein